MVRGVVAKWRGGQAARRDRLVWRVRGGGLYLIMEDAGRDAGLRVQVIRTNADETGRIQGVFTGTKIMHVWRSEPFIRNGSDL